MGYVSKTERIGEVMVSHTFGSYDDFVKWSMQQDDAVPSPFSEESCLEEQYTLTLDEHEVYTLRILLGHCIDGECIGINAKLDTMFVDEVDIEDYNRMYFQFINEDGVVEKLHDGDKDVSIRFK